MWTHYPSISILTDFANSSCRPLTPIDAFTLILPLSLQPVDVEIIK